MTDFAVVLPDGTIRTMVSCSDRLAPLQARVDEIVVRAPPGVRDDTHQFNHETGEFIAGSYDETAGAFSPADQE